MRKILLVSALVPLLFSLQVSAYTWADITTANSLANEGIIVERSTSAEYRLDSTITRAEVLKIAFKIAEQFPMQVQVPPNYTCTGKYFTDVNISDWVCPFVEVGADDGIISRTNSKFRPNDNITRAEALKLVMAVSGEYPISTERLHEMLYTYGNPFDRDSTEWQQRLVVRAEELWIIENYGPFYPNRAATRAEVFGFANEILISILEPSGWEEDSDQGTFDITEYPAGNTFEDNTLSFGNKVIVNGEGGSIEMNECIVRISNTWDWGETFNEYAEVLWMKKQNDISYFEVTTDIGRLYRLVLGKNYRYEVMDNSTSKNCLSRLQFNNLVIITSDLAIFSYYNFLNNWDIGKAYNMRLPAWVSRETFNSWYKNVTNVGILESTLKVLGDSTFEFQIQLTENGKVDTYKVKSKVDMNNFTIDNISSVKV